MKIWENENGNLVLELERNQDEVTRFSWILGEGANQHRKMCREQYGEDDIYIRSAISGYLTKVMLDTYLVGTNYTQDPGTVDNPKNYHIEKFIISALRNEHNTDHWLPEELEIMRKYSWIDIL